jgi:hypothetical protein
VPPLPAMRATGEQSSHDFLLSKPVSDSVD